MKRHWKRNVVSRVSSVIVVIRLPISCVSSMASCFCDKLVEDYYYNYYAAFKAPCAGHKDDESQALGSHADLRLAVSVIKRF